MTSQQRFDDGASFSSIDFEVNFSQKVSFYLYFIIKLVFKRLTALLILSYDAYGGVVRKNKQRGKTFKYVYIRSAKELLKHIPLVINCL